MRERRQFDLVAARQLDHLRVFHDVARTLTTSLELSQILLAIMEKMAAFFGPERWSLLMVDEQTNDLYYAIAVGQDASSLTHLRVPLGEGVAGWVAATGNPLVVPEVALDPHWYAFAQRHPQLNIQSIACVPIRSGERTLGVIQLLNSKIDLISEYSISFLRILCDYAAIAIGNARSLQKIHELSITDDATGLFNARRLYDVMEEQVALAPAPFGLLFIDLDHFKRVNDVHGHLVGSKLLRAVADLFRKILKEAGAENLGFRYGGDEFVVLMANTDRQKATQLSVALCHGLRQADFLEEDGLQVKIQGSFGLAVFPEDGDSVQSLLRAADLELYHVKNTVRNSVSVAGEGLIEVNPPQSLHLVPDKPAPSEHGTSGPPIPAYGVRASLADAAPAAAHRGSRARSGARRNPIRQD